MRSRRLKISMTTAAALLALAGCTTKPKEVAVIPPPPIPPLPKPVPQPEPPAGSFAGMHIPARLADGTYLTPNRDLDPAQALWHARVAMNVAALGCRGPEGDAITAAYNSMLQIEKKALDTAHDAVLHDAGSQAAYDTSMTQLYNYFAQPSAKPAFCAAAAQVASTLVSGGTLSASTLGALDKPFTDFYAAYDQYRTNLAAWQQDRQQRALQPISQAPMVSAAPAATVPVTQEPAQALPEAQDGARQPRLGVDPAILQPH